MARGRWLHRRGGWSCLLGARGGSLVALAILALIAGGLVAGLVSIVRNPRDALLYYRSKRNLVVLPLTFFGCMVAWLVIQAILSSTHPALWALLLGAGVPAIVLAIGLRAIRR